MGGILCLDNAGTRMRTALAAVLLGMLTLTSGCFSGDVNVVINNDGSADLKTTLVSVPMLAEVVEQSKTTALARNPEAQITPVTKENMSGYEISEHYATIEKLSENDFFTAHDGKNTGVTVNKSLFYTDYNFDLLFSGSENGGGAGAFASNITFTYQMNLPVVPRKLKRRPHGERRQDAHMEPRQNARDGRVHQNRRHLPHVEQGGDRCSGHRCARPHRRSCVLHHAPQEADGGGAAGGTRKLLCPVDVTPNAPNDKN